MVFGEGPEEASLVGGVPIRNAGSGLALIQTVKVMPPSRTPIWDAFFIGATTVMPSERTKILWTVPLDVDRVQGSSRLLPIALPTQNGITFWYRRARQLS